MFLTSWSRRSSSFCIMAVAVLICCSYRDHWRHPCVKHDVKPGSWEPSDICPKASKAGPGPGPSSNVPFDAPTRTRAPWHTCVYGKSTGNHGLYMFLPSKMQVSSQFLPFTNPSDGYFTTSFDYGSSPAVDPATRVTNTGSWSTFYS